MGIARQNPEFVTDRCLCSKIFKGSNGRHEFNLHAMKCTDQIAYRTGNLPGPQVPSTMSMDSKSLSALEDFSEKLSNAAKMIEEKKK